MICGHSFIPEFWFEHPDRVGALVPESAVVEIEPVKMARKTYLVTGYACAKAAERISRMERDEVVKKTLAQLDEIFGSKSVTSALMEKRHAAKLAQREIVNVDNPPNPATNYYIDAMIIDWGKNTNILGGYSSPAFGQTPEMRQLWSFPIKDKLYFAGEAFNKDSIMTLHGAMETSVVVSNHILKKGASGKKAKL